MEKIIRFLFGVTLLISITSSCGQTSRNNEKPEQYKDQNVSFTYPAKWETASSDMKSAFRQQSEGQLNVYDGKILELEIYILESASSTMLVFNKANVSDKLTMDSLLIQRKQVENDAIASGYVSKLNTLEIKKINGISMLIEEFCVKNDSFSGRSYGMRAIVNSVIYEFTVAGIDDSDFIKYKGYLDEIIKSFVLNKR